MTFGIRNDSSERPNTSPKKVIPIEFRMWVLALKFLMSPIGLLRARYK